MKYISWDRAEHLKNGKKPQKEMERAARLGISLLMPHLRNIDFPLEKYCAAAKENGIEVHPWVKPTFGVSEIAVRKLSPEKKAEQKAQYGTELARACLNHPANIEQGIEGIKKLIEEFGDTIKGIHLDYIRNDNALLIKDYPCECEACRKSRRKWLGHETLTKEDLQTPAIMYKELQTRNRNITGFVRETRKLVDKAGIKLSIAARANYLNQFDIEEPPVYGLGPAVYEGQDWHEWAEEGMLDFICTMNYHTDLNIFERVLKDHIRLLCDTSAEFYSGLGIQSSMGALSPEQTAPFIEKIKETEAKGASIFHFDAISETVTSALISLD
jgi:uncharacterized lipoprotein YddW (UPF0748 family)